MRILESDGDGSQPSPEPWVYRPEPWDQEELHELYKRSPPPTSVPEEIAVTLVGEDGNTTSLNLIATETSFRIPSIELNYFNIRYVTTNCRALCSDAETDRFVILMSTRQKVQGEPYDVNIFNMFIRPDSADSALAVLNFLQYHIFQFLKSKTEQEDPSVLLQYLRPLIVNEFEVQVHWRKKQQTWEGKRVLIVDQECLALYSKPYEESPRELMFFWSEQHERSCAKVSRIKSAECILLQSRQLYIIIGSKQEMVPELEKAFRDTIKSIPGRAFEEPSLLLQVLGGDYMDISQDPSNVATQRDLESVELDLAQVGKLEKLQLELNQGLDTVSVSQLQTMWDTIRTKLELEVLNDSLPYVYENSWMYDPSSVDDLLRVIRRIEEEMFVKVNYSKALAMTLAMKKIFLESLVIRIRKMMEEDHMDLLYKIFARGNVSLEKLPKATADQLLEQQQPGDGLDDLPEDANDLEDMQASDDDEDL